MSSSWSLPLVRKLAIVTVTATAIAALAALRIWGAPPAFNGTPYPDNPPAPEFTLTDHAGRATSLSDYQDRVVLLFFGFTRCPDVCPLTLTRLSRLLQDSGIGPERVAILLVTVDPEHDTPQRLAEYVARYGGSVTGLRAEPADLPDLLASYGVFAEPMPDHQGHPTLAHTDLVFGIDAKGRLRVLIHGDAPENALLNDVRILLRSRG